MKIDFSRCTEEDLWKYVAWHLSSRGIETILVGGAVVSIYSRGIYKSGDLDFVLGSIFRSGLDEAMREIDFHRSGRHYIHEDCKHLFIEFPGSIPLGIGEDYSIKPDEHLIDGRVIKILSPTDCIKDRLATYAYFNDRDGLDQALLVAREHNVNIESIKKWCQREKQEAIFDEFIKLLKTSQSSHQIL